ncbi:hypothetical protein BDZ89DRAFT_1057642, partial [Hymenopellis radicata]
LLHATSGTRPRSGTSARPQDLAPRNMILDAGGRLWLVDWGHAARLYGVFRARGPDACNAVQRENRAHKEG